MVLKRLGLMISLKVWDVIERSLGDLTTGGVREPRRAEIVDAFTDQFNNVSSEVDKVLKKYAEVFDNQM